MKILFFSLLILLAFLGLYSNQAGDKSSPHYPTEIIEASDYGFLIANKGNKTVALYRNDFTLPLSIWKFGDAPTGMVANKEFAFITCFEKKGSVYFLNLKTGEVEDSLVTGSGAISPMLSPNGQFLYVLNQFRNTVTKIDLDSRQIIASVEVLREPKCAVIDFSGKYLFVANFLPKQHADADLVTASVSVIDLESFTHKKDIPLANGSNALRGICLSPDGEYVLVVHNLGRFGLPTNQLLQGWMNTSAMSMIETRTFQYTASILLDDPERGAAGVWDIQSDGDKILVTHSGTHEVSVIDYPAFLTRYEAYQNKERLSYDLTFLKGIRERVQLVGNGPRNFYISDGKAYIPTYFSDTLNIFNLADGRLNFVSLNEERAESAADRGERIFNDAMYCFQNWQSCNGCHPGDARTDGLNWDLLNDGVGNPKNTKSLLYSHVTPPVMISGIRDRAETAVRKGFTHIQFAEISEERAVYVDEYLKSLRPVASPYLVDGRLSEIAERGKLVFESLGCGFCHSGSYYTDMNMHRIGDDIEFEKGWDTPALIEVWRTAPYLFDGRAATMKEVFSVHKHGINNELSDKETDELVAFVNSL